MRKLTVFYLVLICSLSMASLSYGLMLSSDELIGHAQNFSSNEAKTAYLLKQAEIFMSKKKYQEAEHLASYVSEHFPENGTQANRILAKLHPNNNPEKINAIKIAGELPTLTEQTTQSTASSVIDNLADRGAQEKLR